VNLTGSFGASAAGVNMTIVCVGFPDFLPDLTGVGAGLKLCFFSTDLFTLSFKKVEIFRDILCLPECRGTKEGVFIKELIICLRYELLECIISTLL